MRERAEGPTAHLSPFFFLQLENQQAMAALTASANLTAVRGASATRKVCTRMEGRRGPRWGVGGTRVGTERREWKRKPSRARKR